MLEASENRCEELEEELRLVDLPIMEKIRQGAGDMSEQELHDAILMRTLQARPLPPAHPTSHWCTRDERVTACLSG